MSCDGRVVKALDSKSNGIFPRVIWNGESIIEGAAEALSLLKHRHGKKVCLVTNNSTKSPLDYLNKCEKLGIHILNEEEIVSSSTVAAYYLKHKLHVRNKVYVIGGPGLGKELDKIGIQHVGIGADHFEDYHSEERIFDVNLEKDVTEIFVVSAVIVGFDPHISYAKILKASSYLKNKDCLFVATNEDSCFPSTNPLLILPGAGSVLASVKVASGREPIVIGKPHRPILTYLKEKLGLDPSKTLMTGDTLATDIAFAKRHGLASMLVLSGNTTLEDVKNARTELSPDYYANSLKTLCELEGEI
ncbi:Phosphoglycolate phosphatase [Trichinella nativa]|uniref:Phosphoglycolate phosphatase n=1 Tax=Trichinella nativa TaxID=6335 RepID=A0A0V1LQW2_9BILA|nr:Phosphoglycolate phosphatase [Trichinella nativa]